MDFCHVRSGGCVSCANLKFWESDDSLSKPVVGVDAMCRESVCVQASARGRWVDRWVPSSA